MHASLRRLLVHVIDYAGLFPPANLPLDLAVRNYARYREGPEAWMLGRFVIPAARLGELRPYRDELFTDAMPYFAFSVLGPAGEAWEPWREDLNGTIGWLRTFRDEWRGLAGADVLELKVPYGGVPPDETAKRLRELGDALDNAGLSDVALFFEFGLDDMTSGLEAVARLNRDGGRRVGVKLRCGGMEASAFPGVVPIAALLHGAAARRVGIKATAGLHHPIRRFDPSLGTHTHGFINLFTAALLAYTCGADAETIAAVLSDEDATHFTYTDHGLIWKDQSVATPEIAAVRRNDFLTSFGSCSFDEPRDDLRALGWM